MTQPKQNPMLAAGLILLASACVAVTTLFAKALGQDVLGPALHPFQITFGRFAFALAGLCVAMAVLRPRFHAPNYKLHAGRSFLGFSGVSCMFLAVALIPLPDATAISFLNPVFGMMLAIPFLGEKVGPYRWLATAIALIGALILIRPTANSFHPAALIALMAAVFLGAELIFIKILSRSEASLQILFINNCFGFLFSGIAAILAWQAPTVQQWGALAGIGIFMLLAQTCYVNAMKRADASYIAPFSYTTLLFAALYDFGWFGVVPDAVSIIGAAIICAGALILALREGRIRTPRV